MESTTSKCVMVLDENLPLGLLANTAAILGITLGKHMPEAVGADVLDGSGKAHLGIITFPVPILRGGCCVWTATSVCGIWIWRWVFPTGR